MFIKFLVYFLTYSLMFAAFGALATLAPKLLKNRQISRIKWLKSDLEGLNDLTQLTHRIAQGNYKEYDISIPFTLNYKKGLSSPVGMGVCFLAFTLFWATISVLIHFSNIIPMLFSLFSLSMVIWVFVATPKILELLPENIKIKMFWSKSSQIILLDEIQNINLKLSTTPKIPGGKTLIKAIFLMKDGKKILVAMDGFSAQSLEHFLYFCSIKLKDRETIT